MRLGRLLKAVYLGVVETVRFVSFKKVTTLISIFYIVLRFVNKTNFPLVFIYFLVLKFILFWCFLMFKLI